MKKRKRKKINHKAYRNRLKKMRKNPPYENKYVLSYYKQCGYKLVDLIVVIWEKTKHLII